MSNTPSQSFISDAHPLSFTFLNKGDQPTLYLLSDQKAPQANQMFFSLTNESKAQVHFPTATGEPSSTNYHVVLRFRPGILTEIDHIKLKEDTHWKLKVVEDKGTEKGVVSLYLLSKAELKIEKSKTLKTAFTGLSAEKLGGMRSTRVEMVYRHLIMANKKAEKLTGVREQTLSIVSHLGREHIPLELETVRIPSVVNDGKTENSITLRIKNVGEETIHFGEHPEFSIRINEGAGLSDLTTHDRVRNIKIAPPLYAPSQGEWDEIIEKGSDFAIYSNEAKGYFFRSEDATYWHEIVVFPNSTKMSWFKAVRNHTTLKEKSGHVLFTTDNKLMCTDWDAGDYRLYAWEGGVTKEKSCKYIAKENLVSQDNCFKLKLDGNVSPLGVYSDHSIAPMSPTVKTARIISFDGNYEKLRLVKKSDVWVKETPFSFDQQGKYFLSKIVFSKKVTRINPGESITFNVENIITNSALGQTPITIHYKNIPGFWDGHLSCAIEKSRLLNTERGIEVKGVGHFDGIKGKHLDETGEGVKIETDDVVVGKGGGEVVIKDKDVKLTADKVELEADHVSIGKSESSKISFKGENDLLPVGTIIMWHPPEGTTNPPFRLGFV